MSLSVEDFYALINLVGYIVVGFFDLMKDTVIIDNEIHPLTLFDLAVGIAFVGIVFSMVRDYRTGGGGGDVK